MGALHPRGRRLLGDCGEATMTGLELLLAVAGLLVTVLVVAGMILITPHGAMSIHAEPADSHSSNLSRAEAPDTAPDGPGRPLVEERGTASRPTAVGARTNQLARSVDRLRPRSALRPTPATHPGHHLTQPDAPLAPAPRLADRPRLCADAARSRLARRSRSGATPGTHSSVRATRWIHLPRSARYRRGFEPVARFVPRSDARIEQQYRLSVERSGSCAKRLRKQRVEVSVTMGSSASSSTRMRVQVAAGARRLRRGAAARAPVPRTGTSAQIARSGSPDRRARTALP